MIETKRVSIHARKICESYVDAIGELHDKPPTFKEVAGRHLYVIAPAESRWVLISNDFDLKSLMNYKYPGSKWFITDVDIVDELAFDYDGESAIVTTIDYLDDLHLQKTNLGMSWPQVVGDTTHTEFDRRKFTAIFARFIMNSDAIYDYVEEVMYRNGFVGDFHIWKNHEEEVFFCHMPSGTIVSWYKWNHIGRANWSNKTMTPDGLEAFFKVLRLDVIDEIKDKPEYFDKDKPDMFRKHKKPTEDEIRKAMDKLNRNTMYGGLVNTDKVVSRIHKALANRISPSDPASLYPDTAIYGSLEDHTSTDDTDKAKTMYKFATMALETVCSYFNKLDSDVLIKRNDDAVFLRVYKVDGHRIDVRKEGAFITVDDVNTGELLIFNECIANYVNSSESLKIKFSDFALGKSELDKLKTLPIVSNVLKDFLLNIYDALYDFT